MAKSINLSISLWFTSMEPGQAYTCPIVIEVTVSNMDKNIRIP